MYRRSDTKMKRIFSIVVVSMLLFFINGCTNNDAEKKESDYDKTKKMVVDILQTEDGKKALAEIMEDEEMKEKLVINSDDVETSITNVLSSEQGKEMWKDLFNDPSFVKSYAESMSTEQEKLLKKLMNDAEFQKQMLDLLQNPTINDQMLTILKGQKFRSHIEEIIKETLDTPLFQEKIATLLLDAAEKKKKNEENDKEKDEGGGGDGEGEGDEQKEE